MQMVLILAVSLVDKCFDAQHHKPKAKKVSSIQENPKIPTKTNNTQER